MGKIPAAWIVPYYVQVKGQDRQEWVGSCVACRCKFFGEYARERHMQMPRHQAMLRKWLNACRMAGMDAPPVINFVV